MKIQRTIYILAIPALKKSAEFFRNVLGFTIHEIGDQGWRMFARDKCRIMAGHCPDAIHPSQIGDHSYFEYFVVDNVDDYYRTVTSKGAEIIKPLKSEKWGIREFGIRTIDGHRIMIGQDPEE
ncbi:MAG: VOC family protein [Cyanobacteria bacterium P01_D01_bin.56]